MATDGSICWAGQQPLHAPIVTGKTPVISEDQEWTPLLFHQEHQPMPALRGVFEGIKQGGHENFERAIRAAYRLMEAYGHNEGKDIAFQLSDFKTLEATDVLDRKLSEVVSVGAPERITVAGVVRENSSQDKPNGPIPHKSTKVGYEMKWVPAVPDPNQALWTVRRYVQIAKSDQTAPSRLHAVTTYRVSVKLAGAQRDYRAAFFWMNASTAPVIGTFYCLDPVVERVTLTLTEQVPPEGKEEGDPVDLKPDAGNSPKWLGPVCNVYTEYPPSILNPFSGYERHVNSSWHHISQSEVDASCSCSGACQSICHTSVGLNLCYDEGNTVFGYHVSATNQRLTTTTVQNALNAQNGAGCQGTIVCAFTQCPTQNCEFSVTVNTSGIGFSTNPLNTAVLWAVEPTNGFTCGGCTEYQGPTTKPEPPPQDNTPVLIALDEERLEMTDLAGGVRFDLNRDGTAEHNSWPAASSSWAFVVLDRNRNGRIDDGGELFGNYTMQYLDDRPPNGYAALAVYDRPEYGGNGDGVLDDRDVIFPSLLLWADANHDGVSQPQELVPLAQRVEEIGLDYRESHARDRYGNQFRYRGTIRLADGRKSRSVDVILLHD